MVTTSLTIQDVLTHRTAGKEMITDAFLPFLILPALFLIASFSLTLTIIVMVAIAMGVLYVYSRPRQKNRSPFFYSWTLASGVTMFLIFNLVILRYQEITKLENFVFLLLVACTCYFFYKMKAIAQFELALGPSKGKEYSPVITSDSKYCHICQIEVNDQYFHSIWWDCCVIRPNYMYFVLGQLFSLCAMLVGIQFGLTTICQLHVMFGFLVPDDCSHVYEDFSGAISFVACVYALGYVCVISLIMLKQIFVFIPKYSEPQWRRLLNVLHV